MQTSTLISQFSVLLRDDTSGKRIRFLFTCGYGHTLLKLVLNMIRYGTMQIIRQFNDYGNALLFGGSKTQSSPSL